MSDFLVYADVFLAGMFVGVCTAALYWRPQRWVKQERKPGGGGV